MMDFRNVLTKCCLNDLGFNGPWFTWEWGTFAANNIHEHLDRGLSNLAWWDWFSSFSLWHLPLMHVKTPNINSYVKITLNSSIEQ